MNLNFGLDPEYFASYTGEDGNPLVISPAMLEVDGQIKPIAGDLKHPVFLETNLFKFIMDGVAFELTVKAPKKSAKEIHSILKDSHEALEEFLSKLSWNGQKLSLYKKPVININPKIYLDKISDERIYQGFIFGCDPDLDAQESDYHCGTISVEKHPYRYAGGHIHLSDSDSNLLYEECRAAIKLFGIFVGTFCLANSPYPEQEKIRATTYGRPFRFRQQKYPGGINGVEYRTPSTSWTSFSLEKMEELFEMVKMVPRTMENVPATMELFQNYLPLVEPAIVNADQELAKKVFTDALEFMKGKI